MIFSSETTSLSQSKSPLCSEEFLQRPSQLPAASSPPWMKTGLVITTILTVLCAIVVLVSPMDECVNAPGEVRPSNFAFVFSKADGILESAEITDGAFIIKGQVLAKLDGWEKKKEISRIEGEVSQAHAELDLAHAAARKVAAAPVPPEFLFSAVEMERQEEIQNIQQDYLKRLQELQKNGSASGTELLNLRK